MDRIERHDVVNAIGLALILMGMALALLFGARALFRTLNDGIVDAEKPPEVTAPATTTTDPSLTTTTEATTTTATIRIPGEVITRVGNGAQRSGIAGGGTSLLDQAGYVTLAPKNAPPREDSIIYYAETFEADAAQVARLLGVAETAIAPMPADPGVPIEDAQVIAILGRDTTVG